MASAFLSDSLHRRHGGRFITGFFYSTQNALFLDFCLLHGACIVQTGRMQQLYRCVKGNLSGVHPVLPAAGAIACAVSGLMLYGTGLSEIFALDMLCFCI